MPEHFAAPPNWGWWILAYFFFGGLAGGSYAIGTLVRFMRRPEDQQLARTAFIVSFLALVPCPLFLIADLGVPTRFLNLLFDASEGGLAFKVGTPISLGAWALLGFGLFSFVSFLGAMGENGTRALEPVTRVLRGVVGTVWSVVGTVLGFFIAGYTGVLLAASNEPVWSDAGWFLGGLFLASALSGSAALLLAIAGWRRTADAGTTVRLEAADRGFAFLEAILLVLFVVSVELAGTLGKLLGVWIVLWVVVIIGLATPFVMARMGPAGRVPAAGPAVALLGVLALRALVIFGAQS
jgi:formate-dependent nitrite reductase membrane component NrfD